MDSSERSRAVIELGKRIVAEVGIRDDERDTLGRWLAHDIARQITEAETLSGPAGAAARQACAAAILNLWEHRAAFPHDSRPFAAVEPALQVLQRLDLNNGANRYFVEPRRGKAKDDWLTTATAIDRAARVLLRACVRLAVRDDGGKAAAFVRAAEKAGLHRDPDMALVRIILMSEKDDEPADPAAVLRAEEAEALKTFGTVAKKIRTALQGEEAAATTGLAGGAASSPGD